MMVKERLEIVCKVNRLRNSTSSSEFGGVPPISFSESCSECRREQGVVCAR